MLLLDYLLSTPIALPIEAYNALEKKDIGGLSSDLFPDAAGILVEANILRKVGDRRVTWHHRPCRTAYMEVRNDLDFKTIREGQPRSK